MNQSVVATVILTQNTDQLLVTEPVNTIMYIPQSLDLRLSLCFLSYVPATLSLSTLSDTVTISGLILLQYQARRLARGVI